MQMNPADVGKPTFFVSHRWGCKFHFIYGLLEEFMTNQNPPLKEEETFFWIDIFAVNQHPGEDQQADLTQLENAIGLAEKTLLCIDNTGMVVLFWKES